MSATQARSGFGALFQRGDGGAPEVFSTIAEVQNIGRVSTKLNTVDATHMESPDQHMEKIATLLESGDINVSGNYLPGDTSQGLVRTDQLNRTLRNWKITIPGSSKVVTFSAFVADTGPDFPHDNKMSFEYVFTPSGKISIA